jgi:hypothetical protein
VSESKICEKLNQICESLNEQTVLLRQMVAARANDTVVGFDRGYCDGIQHLFLYRAFKTMVFTARGVVL